MELSINDEEIDNPGLIIKSKFKHYLPELQETLEIPVTERQQSIRESFIPKKINYHHFGLRSKFRKDLFLATPKSVSSIQSASKSTAGVDSDDSDDDNDNDNDNDNDDSDSNDNDENSTISSISPTNLPKVHSRRSWVKDFLMFKENEHIDSSEAKSKYKKNNNKNKASNRDKTDDFKLQSKITNYDDTISDPRDLKRWVRMIADEGKDQQYVPSKYVYTNEIELDIEEFIRYLVEEQGFNATDLEFLRSKNLDYGLGEIEQELNKLKETKGSPKVIDIGGEHDNGGSDSSSRPLNSPTNAFFAIFIVCAFLI